MTNVNESGNRLVNVANLTDYPDDMPALASGLYSTSPLLPLYAAIANRNNARVDILVIGDSATEGNGASSFTKRGVAVASRVIRSAYPTTANGSAGGMGWIGINSTGSTTYTWPITLASGSIGSPYDLGPVRNSPNGSATSPVWTFTAPAGTTSVALTYFDAVTPGGFTYQVGSGTVVTVANTNTYVDKRTANITLTAGQVLTVRAMSSGNCGFTGLLHYAGDETSGITFHGLGRYGWTTGTSPYSPSGWNAPETLGGVNWAQAFVNAFPSTKAIVIQLGGNDAATSSGNRTAAQWQSDLTGFISTIRGAATPLATIPILLVTEGWGNVTVADSGGWAAYAAAARAVAAADGKAAVIDLTYRMPPESAGVAGGSLFYDTVHPSDLGYEFVGSMIAGAIEGLTPQPDDLVRWNTTYAAMTKPAAADDVLVRDAVAGGMKRLPLKNLAAPLGGIPRILYSGHSFMSGYLNNEGGENWPRLLNAALGAEGVDYSLSGCVLAQDDAGGYAAVLNAFTPRVAETYAYAVRNFAPYIPLAPVTVFQHGGNDTVAVLGANAMAMFSMALTASACIARAGGWFPDTDSSVVYSTGWTANTGTGSTGWPTNHSATATGKTVTITVPADFPGGEIDLLTLAHSGGTKWSATVDGGTAHILDGTSSAYGSAAGHSNLVVQRLSGLTAGTHTVVLTDVTIDTGATAVFAGWLIAAPQTPLVVLCNEMNSPGHDASALNTAIAAVAAGFTDGMVQVADMAGYFAAAGGNVDAGVPGSLYASDNYHPNMAGHMMMAQCVYDVISASIIGSFARFGPAGIVMRQINAPGEPALAGTFEIADGMPCWFGSDRSGNTVVNMNLVNTTDPSHYDTIVELPNQYSSLSGGQVPGFGWTDDYSTIEPAAAAVNNDGVFQWLCGGTQHQLTLAGVFQADGLGA